MDDAKLEGREHATTVMIYRTALRLMGRAAWAEPAAGPDPLRDVATDVATRFPGINHMQPGELATLLADQPATVALFDVRAATEFAVSHLPGAVLVPPLPPWGSGAGGGMAARATVQRALADRPAVAWAVFYCAVGVRSSALATYCQRELMQLSPGRTIAVVNLAGGLFRWANDNGPMVDGQMVDGQKVDGTAAATTNMHPFNRHWGQFLVKRPST